MLRYMNTTDPEIQEKVVEKVNDPESSEKYRKNLLPDHILAKANAARAVSKIQGKGPELLHKMRSSGSRGRRQSESRSDAGSSQGEGKESLPINWRDLSPVCKREALVQAGVCMRSGGNHGKRACKHADLQKECERCG